MPTRQHPYWAKFRVGEEVISHTTGVLYRIYGFRKVGGDVEYLLRRPRQQAEMPLPQGQYDVLAMEESLQGTIE